jgi:hypothetical protein
MKTFTVYNEDDINIIYGEESGGVVRYLHPITEQWVYDPLQDWGDAESTPAYEELSEALSDMRESNLLDSLEEGDHNLLFTCGEVVACDSCASCGTILFESEFFGGECTDYEGQPICECCYYEAEPCAVLRLNPLSGFDPLYITHSCNDAWEEGLGEWRVSWHSTDPWRGYYEISAPEGWLLVNTDQALWGHRSEAMLEKFHDNLCENLQEMGIDLVFASCVTSNLFCTNVDWYVNVGTDEDAIVRMMQVSMAVAAAKGAVNYDDPAWRRGILFPEFDDVQSTVEELLGRKVETDYDIVDAAEELLEKLQEKSSTGESG